MALVTTPGKKVNASEVDPHDPKQILKARHLTQYQKFDEADIMTPEVEKMGKDIKQMTQQELLSAIADEGDKNRRLAGKHCKPPPGDPRTWKFEGIIQELLDAYDAKFVPEENLLADDVEHFCICNGPDDGRPMIECSNGRACLMNWFHLGCIGMSINEVPDEQEDWFCKRCVDNKLSKLRKNAPKSISSYIMKKPNADRIKHYDVVEQTAAEATAKDDEAKKKLEKNKNVRAKVKEKQKQKTLVIRTIPSKLLEMSTPSPGTLKPWTAELDRAFVEDPEVAETYGLHSIASAKASLLLTTVKDGEGDLEMSDATSEPTAKNNKGSWTKEEKDHLADCVTESHQAGRRGEDLWNEVYPNMVARGVNRPLGGMRMTWLRELRQQIGLDERRRQNASKMRTAVQKSKKKKKTPKAADQDAEMEGWEGDEVEDMEDVEEVKGTEVTFAAAALAMIPSKPITYRTRANSV